MYDLRKALSIRSENVASRNPELAVRYTIYTDDRTEWGILSIFAENGKVIGLEFFESEESWMRPGAVRDYNIAADEGYPVAVVVPDNVYREFRRSAVERGGEGFSTYLYSDMGIGPMIQA
jgi:hypothetical protein